jgi:hypothetical protein
LLALAIATAGASLHMLVLVTHSEPTTHRVTCSTRADVSPSVGGLVGDPSYLEAVELRCRAGAADRCDVANVMGRVEAIVRAEATLGAGTADHAFVRFAPEHGRIVWSVRDLDASTRAELDAFDGRALEYAIDVPAQ